MEALENSPHVHRVIVTDRDATIHYDNTRGPDARWTQDPRAAEALREARSEGRVPFDQAEAAAWVSSYWQYSEQLLERGELGPVTVPTMVALHKRADRVAQIAYAGDAERLSEHAQWQSVQKVVLMAAERGAPNADLPRHPRAFLEADATRRAQYVATFKSVGKTASGTAAGAKRAAKLAAKGMAPPTIRSSPPSRLVSPPGRHRSRDKGPDIER